MSKVIKQKKCVICGSSFSPRTSLQRTCSDHIYQWYRQQKEKAEAKKWRSDKKRIKEKLKTLSQYEKEARREFQKWIRWRDREEPCISCGATTAKQWHAGHYMKAELYSGMIFDERNCRRQCSRCNDLYSGMQAEYRQQLVVKFGREYVEKLEEDANRLRKYKYTKEQLISIKEKYKKKLKEVV